MTENAAAPIQGTVPLSTSIDIDTKGGPLGAGQPSLTEPKEPAKPESAGDTLRSELSRIREEEESQVKDKGEAAAKAAKEKADKAKGEDAEKPAKARAEDGKFSKPKTDDESAERVEQGASEKTATGQEATDRTRQSEGQKYHEPPARFLPKEKEVWANVPHVVKAAIARLSQEDEQATAQFKTSHERYEPIRQYDEIARQNGRELKQSLEKVVQVEQAIARNPIAGIEMILREVGPRKQDGQPYSLMEIAQHLVQNPQAYQQATRPQLVGQPQQRPQAQQQPSAEVFRLQEGMKSIMEATVIAPFKVANPRYHELEKDIAFFLQSGKIPASLSPQEKLEAAYDMAARINPASSSVSSREFERPADVTRAPSDDAGAKSVRGAPTGGHEPDDDDASDTDIKTMLRRQMRKLAS